MKATLSGLRAWVVQRVTAIGSLLFLLYFALHLLLAPPSSQQAWQAWLATPAMKIALILFFGAVALHAWVGMRDVVLDYVKPLGLRLACLGLLVGTLVATVAWVAVLLLPLA